jgi:hypothetical protein
VFFDSISAEVAVAEKRQVPGAGVDVLLQDLTLTGAIPCSSNLLLSNPRLS